MDLETLPARFQGLAQLVHEAYRHGSCDPTDETPADTEEFERVEIPRYARDSFWRCRARK